MGAIKKIKGFTLIEVIVVISIIGLILPALFYMVFMLLLQQVKIYRLSEVKRQGDFALTAMSSTIRDSAVSIYDSSTGGSEYCAASGESADLTTNGYFRDQHDNWFRFTLTNGRLASQSAIAGANTDLTVNRVTISDVSLSCYRSASYSPPIIHIKFTVTAGDATARAEERSSLTYETRIKMRSY